MHTLWLKVFVFVSIHAFGSFAESHTLCAFSKKDYVKYHPKPNPKYQGQNEGEFGSTHATSGIYVDANNTEHCTKDTDSCFVLWQEDPQNKSMVILTQGCWDSSGDPLCSRNECIAYKKPTKALNNTKFCCCSGNMCNINVTEGYIKHSPDPVVEEPPWEATDHMSYTTQVIIIVVVVVAFAVIVTVTYFLAKLCCNSPKRSNESLHLMEAPPPLSSNVDLDTLKIQETVGRGRYGSVCRGVLNDHTVAVKIFCYQNRQYFLNERDIYLLPQMDHPSLPRYIGSEERNGIDGRPEYLLVVSFSPVGCLQDYLRNTTIDWSRLCKMILSITQGLAHLHTEFGKGEKFKPCIAHRDLTSRNILVKPDGSCMLCDFGFAIRISGSKYYMNGEEQIAETTSLADVGTLRYMAPEILEGAVNLRDCESSLKQIDVYALGLVLWEVATRCSDLFQGVEVPDYKLPFEAEVGLHPTMEQMQILVVKHKARPLFPDIWKGTNPAIRALKETIEDCWDQDAEARLTTLCVEERLSELPVTWERYKAGLGIPGSSPTFNTTSNLDKSSLDLKKNNESDSDLVSDAGDERLICPRERSNSLSECTTETLLSPSEPNVALINEKNLANSAAVTPKVTIPLQPYQGRNPCLARNLMMESQDDVPAKGNSLIDCPSKFTVETSARSFSDGDTNSYSLPNGHIANGDIANHSTRICNSIPYLQNPVSSVKTIPKQPNVPGNGHSSSSKDEKRWHIFDSKNSIRAGIKSLLDRKSSGSSLSEERQPLRGSGVGHSPLSPDIIQGQTNPVDYLWPHKENTEATNGANNSTKQLNNTLEDPSEKLTDNGTIVEEPDATNVPLQNESIHSLPEKSKRPSTLPVQTFQNGHLESDSDDVPHLVDVQTAPVRMRRKGSNGKRKGVKRVKTPFEIKGRFSLYDDRIMSSQDLPATSVCPTVTPPNAKFSASVPLDMNTLCIAAQSSDSVCSEKSDANKQTKPLNGYVVPPSIKGHQNVFTLCDI